MTKDLMAHGFWIIFRDKSLARRTSRKTPSSCLWFSKITWNIPFVSYCMQKIVNIELQCVANYL